MAARRTSWLFLLVVLIVGGVLGAGAVIASVEVNRDTSTDEFCTSCHSMTFVGNDPHYVQSAHRTNSAGVRPSCGDCHIPQTNWFVETWTHVKSGVRDVVAENTNDFSDPEAWEKRRIELAHEVRQTMREQALPAAVAMTSTRCSRQASADRPLMRWRARAASPVSIAISIWSTPRCRRPWSSSADPA